MVTDLNMEDYTNVINALLDGTSQPASVSFAIHWKPSFNRFKVRDPKTDMAGEFVQNTATMTWSATSASHVYFSGPENSSTSISAQIGHERNGVFFQ